MLLHPRSGCIGAVAFVTMMMRRRFIKDDKEECPSLLTTLFVHKFTMKFFAAIITFLLTTLVAAQVTFTNCAPAGTTPEFTVSTFSLSPYPLCINQNVCASATGQLSVVITQGATLSIIGRFLGRIVYTDIQDLCALLAAAGYPCPVAMTRTTITVCILVKPNAPAVSEISMLAPLRGVSNNASEFEHQ